MMCSAPTLLNGLDEFINSKKLEVLQIYNSNNFYRLKENRIVVFCYIGEYLRWMEIDNLLCTEKFYYDQNNKLKNLTIQTQNNTNCNNTNNNTNIVNNNITIKVSRFGFERRDKLTPEENKDIIDGGKNCLLRCISTFHFNKRLPEYRNVLFSNLKSSRLINNECKAFVIYKLNMNIIIECFAFNNYITCQ